MKKIHTKQQELQKEQEDSYRRTFIKRTLSRYARQVATSPVPPVFIQNIDSENCPVTDNEIMPFTELQVTDLNKDENAVTMGRQEYYNPKKVDPASNMRSVAEFVASSIGSGEIIAAYRKEEYAKVFELALIHDESKRIRQLKETIKRQRENLDNRDEKDVRTYITDYVKEILDDVTFAAPSISAKIHIECDDKEAAKALGTLIAYFLAGEGIKLEGKDFSSDYHYDEKINEIKSVSIHFTTGEDRVC